MHDWSQVPALIDAWVEKCAAPAWDIRRALADVYTHGDVGIYLNPEQLPTVGLYYRGDREKIAQDLSLVSEAVGRVVGLRNVFSICEEAATRGELVKVAYSPTLRRASELLNFLPGKYPGGFPNAPSPLAATLTSGLVGAGLGYGAGALGETMLPAKWKRGKLRKTLALAGAGALSLPGLAWMYSAHARGKGLWDGSGVADAARPEPAADPLGEQYKAAVDHFIKEAWGEESFDTMPGGGGQGPDPWAIDISRLGQTLWETGADPQTTATTMGTIYAAQQMPDPHGRPGFATPRQTGLLGTMLGGGAKGYATGWLAGKTLSLLTGMPESTQNMLRNVGGVLGIVNAVVPKLLGQ